MYQGKYQKPVKKRKHRRKPGILIVSLVMLIAVVVGGTAAFLQVSTDPVENTFTPANVNITSSDDASATQKSNIQFQNTGDVPVFVRATLAIYWEDTKGNKVAPPTGGSVLVGETDVRDAAPRPGWTKEGSIYYHDAKVLVGESTSVMMDPITVNVPKGYVCHIDVLAEAIQAEGMGVTDAKAAWEKAANNSGV